MGSRVYSFWFSKPTSTWFQKGKTYDKFIKDQFRPYLYRAQKGQLQTWTKTKNGFVALVLVLDQFPRHIYRNQHKAYLNDNKALYVVETCLPNFYPHLQPEELVFVLLPYQHTTDPNAQQKGISLLRDALKRFPKHPLLRNAMRHQKGHLSVLKRFGRFPKRLDPSEQTPAERKYVKASPNVPY